MPVIWPPKLTLTGDIASQFGNDAADSVTMIDFVKNPGVVNSVQFIPSWSRTGTNTDFRTYTLVNRGASGTGTTTIASLAMTSSNSFVAFTPMAITLQSAANLTVTQGDILEWVSTATGQGAPDPGGLVVVKQSFNP